MRFSIIIFSVFIVTFSISTSIFAADLKDKIEFGIKAGVNTSTTLVSLSNINSKNYLENYTDYKFNAGLNAGFFIEIPVSKKLSFQPEIVFSIKGMRNESFISEQRPASTGYNSREFHAISEMKSYYIELPLYLKTSFDIGESKKIIAGIGPYFAYGIGGSMKSQLKSSAPSGFWTGSKNIFKEDEIDFGTGTWVNDGMSSYQAANYINEPYWHKSIKRIDGGISAFVGYDFQNNLFLTSGCNWGLKNILNSFDKSDVEIDGKMNNLTFSFSLGYKL